MGKIQKEESDLIAQCRVQCCLELLDCSSDMSLNFPRGESRLLWFRSLESETTHGFAVDKELSCLKNILKIS